MPSSLRLGTRGSRLALAQAHTFKAQLLALDPELEVEIITIKTSGDLGKRERLGAFVREIQEALLEEKIDVALHCLKDLPTEGVPGLRFSAYLEREDVRDTFISRGPSFPSMQPGAIVGTGSVRRTSQLRALRPRLDYRPLVGNVDTRLRKLIDGEYDAIVLAHAGLQRLGLLETWSESDYRSLTVHHFSVEDLLPAPGQAVIVAETRDSNAPSDAAIHAIISQLEHEPSRLSADTERHFLKAFGGGCSVPVAAYATIQDGQLNLQGLVASPDGTTVLRDSDSGPSNTGPDLAASMSSRLGEQGAFALFTPRTPSEEVTP